VRIFKIKFNEKIVKLRKLKGLTQDEFAAAVGVSRQAVYKWESGQSYPEVPKLLEMKLLFDISIDDLLDENYEVVLPEKTKKRRISREKKVEIEASVEKEESVELKEEVLVAAPVAEAKEEAKVEEVKAEEVKAEETIEETPSSEDDSDKKKVGFFGRLFGRK
jgi:transcriptional regulator with XRE-family HTH domain